MPDSPTIAQHHASAAYHHDQAARHHREAAHHFTCGKDYAHGAHQAWMAHGHAMQAVSHAQATNNDNAAAMNSSAWCEEIPATTVTNFSRAEHHSQAADHHGEAARRHREAAQRLDVNNTELTSKPIEMARWDAQFAVFLGSDAAKAHVGYGDDTPPTQERLGTN